MGFYGCTSISEKEASIILRVVAEKTEREADITGDLLIMDARDYYVKKKKTAQAASACYYCGRVYLQRKEYDSALNDFLEAEKQATQVHNYELLASIYYYMGVMYTDQLLGNNAVEKLRLALQTIQTHSIEFKKEFELYDLMALSQILVQENADSTILYYHKALSFALIHLDSIRQSVASRQIGACYLMENSIDSARIYLYESIQLDRNKSAVLYYNMAELYYAENNRDSVMHFFNLSLPLAQKDKDNILCSNLYRLLYQLEKNNNNYYQALEFQDIYTDYVSNIFTDKQKNDLLISESKYNYEQTQNKNKQLLIERQYILLAVLGLVIIVISISFYYFWRIHQQKAHTLELEKASLEAEQQIQALQNMAAGFDVKEQSLRMEALSHFEILKKVALLREDEQLNAKTEGYKRSPMERINEIIYGSIQGFDWDTFFNSIRTNVLYKNLFDTIDQKDFFKKLDDMDQRICYLTCMDFGNSEIATLLGYSLRTIEQRKTNLRKNLDIPTKDELKKHLL
ncbi:hypothetical protein FACS189413_09830 [Bacteroidia bacterium]|nr:hypothetical protein FACS189413_09830 [Bacteroidia bacterium]